MNPTKHWWRGMVLAMAFGIGAAWAGEADKAATEPAGGKTLRVLTVGNSFSNNATGMLAKVVESAPFGDQIILSRDASLGGHTFQQHWGYAKSHTENPEDPKGKPYKGKKVSLKEILESQPWDIVTIQQVSEKSWQADTFLPEAELLTDYIKQYAPTAEVVLHQTWAYRVDSPYFNDKNKLTGKLMNEKIREAYQAAAKALGERVIPVGEAFQLAMDDPEWAFKADAAFDPKAQTEPVLPKDHHSLHVGWVVRKKDGQPILNADGKVQYSNDKHANSAGCYLGALVWYGFLFDRDPTAVTFKPASMTEGDAVILRRIAAETLRQFPSKAAVK